LDENPYVLRQKAEHLKKGIIKELEKNIRKLSDE